jgi:hypothetical protein
MFEYTYFVQIYSADQECYVNTQYAPASTSSTTGSGIFQNIKFDSNDEIRISILVLERNFYGYYSSSKKLYYEHESTSNTHSLCNFTVYLKLINRHFNGQ